ncbi:hypothetical protein BCR33DRAFT_451511 [Rhizoclosmatium globosum]|uniref:Uncharacterized protein n=1 Tax=Rhizoclosmatium globosum TaxID=329046 RepID=A0A1Y2CW70_9FUNG|nr:hypothetical protein BCR33DRAFT_451511 [Rhizoclosmatium globosum]|eukprot:ORY51279.1 hypothetical protein BCR33DRAFT_451511 [Rhizoclosmatium globosum]
MNLLLFLLALSDYSSAAKPDNITLAFVSNYCSLQNVAYSSSQLINFTSYEYDQDLITPYQLSAYIFYPDVIMQMAVDAINANPNILPQTYVNVKRFSDCGTWYPTVEADYSGYSGGYGSAMTAQDVAEQNLDVVGVIGNEYSTTAR